MSKKIKADSSTAVPPKPKSDAWKTPVEIDRITQVFPARIMHLLPPYDEIPKEFKDWNSKSFWNRFFNDMFFAGLKDDLKLMPKPGIDPAKAWTVIRTICASFEPKHEHKEAGVAYLMSLWFEEEGSSWERLPRA